MYACSILMLQDPKTSLNDDIFQDGTGRDVDGAAFGGDDDDGSLEGYVAAEVDGTADCEVV